MKHKIITHVVISMIVLMLWYLVFAFTAWDANPNNWDNVARGLFAFIYAVYLSASTLMKFEE